MSSHNEQVKPAPFEVAAPPAVETSTPAAGGAPRWVIPTLVGLLLLAAAVVFWLPGQIGPRQAPPVAEQSAQGDAGDTPAASPRPQPAQGEEASPWSDAQMAKLRKEAQDVLAEVLDLQLQLEDRAVDLWAADAFAEAAAAATAGDELYRQREFVPARESYELARERMQALVDSIPAAVDTQLQLAREAIETGDRNGAATALEVAAAIEPENAELAALQQRADLLQQLLPLLETAQQMEAAGDLAGAEDALRQATQLDPQHQRAARELTRVSAAHLAQQFNDAMSDGYNALDENRFGAARTAFRNAARLEPGSTEAASALQEVEDAATAHRLASLKRSGSGHEAREQWSAAVTAYEEAVQLDPNVLFARDGLERARERARLDKQFRAALDNPERLSDVAVAEASQALLDMARGIEPRGPVLARQLDQLEVLLQQANTPVAVTLQSDRETEVIVYKVARLGRFEQQQLSLRPGTYTAVGTRIGYRDVRRTFTIGHDSPPDPVIIACTEQI